MFKIQNQPNTVWKGDWTAAHDINSSKSRLQFLLDSCCIIAFLKKEKVPLEDLLTGSVSYRVFWPHSTCEVFEVSDSKEPKLGILFPFHFRLRITSRLEIPAKTYFPNKITLVIYLKLTTNLVWTTSRNQ